MAELALQKERTDWRGMDGIELNGRELAQSHESVDRAGRQALLHEMDEVELRSDIGSQHPASAERSRGFHGAQGTSFVHPTRLYGNSPT
ncbi:MAG: hypothetical protein H0W34_04040 [Pyrinomonadaceae bacterium]|nr:hypothetical protein [Pyrinomonadaceae bacterium]